MSSKFLAPALAIGAAILGLAAASLWFSPGAVPSAPISSGTLLPQPRMLNDFQLIGDDGAPFAKARLQGHWTLLFAGFIHCPDVCPTTLASLKALTAQLAASGIQLQIVFLSVDPERDHPQLLANYVHYFNPEFIGVTAAEPELARFTRELGIAYAKVPGPTPESYTMDHSAALVLLNPQAQVAGYFSPPFKVDALAADLSLVIQR